MNRNPAAQPPARRSWSALLRAVTAGVTLTLATVGLTAVAAPASAASSAVMQMDSGTYESKVQALINRKRAAHGLPRLRLESCTDSTAESWASFLADSGSFYHQDMSRIINKCGAYYAGEILGRGAISPRRLVYLWMHSPAHRDVLLSRHARRIGVGAYVADGQWVTAANFTRF